MEESDKEAFEIAEGEKQEEELSADVKQRLILFMLSVDNRKIRSSLSKLLLLNSVIAVGIVAIGIAVWRKS